MSTNTLSLFGDRRQDIVEATDFTRLSLAAHGADHDHWVVAWSGGKDSTCALTVTLYLVAAGLVAAPKRITVLYADTRMELVPLAAGAQAVMARIREIAASEAWQTTGCVLTVETVLAPLEKRFFPYILGRGVPPPNNQTLRWCTPALKVVPMQARVEREFFELNPHLVGVPKAEWPADAKRPLMITGVRLGESAIRDGRIAMSCSKNGAECGQGWYQHTIPGTLTATLAPILHWRVCRVWDWLRLFAPLPQYGAWDTAMLAEAYGDSEAEEINARTGCTGCPLATADTALDALIDRYPDRWGYLHPLRLLRPLYRELRLPQHRHRKHGETNQDGRPSASPYRMGPLTMEARRWAFTRVIEIQEAVNWGALQHGRPPVDLIDAEEAAFIQDCWARGVYPNKWTAGDALATDAYDEVFADGSVQATLFPAAPPVRDAAPIYSLPVLRRAA
ncbi:MAG TPA: hypothetical protein VGB53_00905 [Rubricoccaceae bacterium]|jgi:DNA sulfur modification protein DndC